MLIDQLDTFSSRVTDLGVRHIIESASGTSIQELNVTNCFKVSDVTLLRISQRCVCVCMTCVCKCAVIYSMCVCSVYALFVATIIVTNIVVMLLGRCRSLVYVSFCYCEHITDAGVELMGHMPSLISLDLTGCCLTDQVSYITTYTHTH